MALATIAAVVVMVFTIAVYDIATAWTFLAFAAIFTVVATTKTTTVAVFEPLVT